jgi:hypothetical protein
MREKYFWRAISLLPLLLPLVTIISSRIRNSFMGTPAPPASVGQVFLLGSFFIGGIFYVLFLVITQSIIWSKPVKWDRRATLIAPLIFLVIFVFGFQIYWIVTSSGSWFDSPRLLLSYSLIVLIIGYIYVGIAWGIWVIMRGLGMFKQVLLQD